MNRHCDNIRPLLNAWLDGELSGADRRRVAKHVEECAECRAAADSTRRIDEALHADDAASDPGDAYFDTLGARLEARFDFDVAARRWTRPEPPKRSRLVIPRAWVPRFAFGIASAAVITIAFLVVHDIGGRPVIPSSMRMAAPVTNENAPATNENAPVTNQNAPATETKELAADRKPVEGTDEARRAKDTSISLAEKQVRTEGIRPLRGRPVPPAASMEQPATGTAGANVQALAVPADATAPARPELLAFFDALVRDEHGVPPVPAPVAGSAARVPASPLVAAKRADSGSAAPGAQDTRVASADSTWIRVHRTEARALADSALATGSMEGCERALAAYWRILHRNGRPVLADRREQEQVLAPDRARIEDLLRCASR